MRMPGVMMACPLNSLPVWTLVVNKVGSSCALKIRIAAYIRMNLTTKEISEFMNKTQRAVENDRYRLRKKIGLESNDSIQNYFLNL